MGNSTYYECPECEGTMELRGDYLVCLNGASCGHYELFSDE